MNSRRAGTGYNHTIIPSSYTSLDEGRCSPSPKIRDCNPAFPVSYNHDVLMTLLLPVSYRVDGTT